MLESLQIHNYRSFEAFSAKGLSRVTLFVGKNNSGKSTILEAIRLLYGNQDPRTIYNILTQRGERIIDDRESAALELDVAHLFHGHRRRMGDSFSISADAGDHQRRLDCGFVPFADGQARLFSESEDEEGAVGAFALSMQSHEGGEPLILPLTLRGGLHHSVLMDSIRASSQILQATQNIEFVSTESLTSDRLAAFWRSIALTPDEDRAVRALQVIDPQLERISFVGSDRDRIRPNSRSRDGFLAKESNSPAPVPLGSMGDGMWRLLAITLALLRCKGGILLIDEIDTGLHHSVMTEMWALVMETARRLNVQVFATTHSYDCLLSLARLRDHGPHDVSVHRIEQGEFEAIRFSWDEIAIAARLHIEMR